MPGEHKPLTDLLFAFFKEISQKGKFIASFQWTVTQKKKKKSLTILQLSSDFMRNEKFYPRVTHCSQIRAPSAINISSSRQNNCLIWRFIDLSASLFFFPLTKERDIKETLTNWIAFRRGDNSFFFAKFQPPNWHSSLKSSLPQNGTWMTGLPKPCQADNLFVFLQCSNQNQRFFFFFWYIHHHTYELIHTHNIIKEDWKGRSSWKT